MNNLTRRHDGPVVVVMPEGRIEQPAAMPWATPERERAAVSVEQPARDNDNGGLLLVVLFLCLTVIAAMAAHEKQWALIGVIVGAMFLIVLVREAK